MEVSPAELEESRQPMGITVSSSMTTWRLHAEEDATIYTSAGLADELCFSAARIRQWGRWTVENHDTNSMSPLVLRTDCSKDDHPEVVLKNGELLRIVSHPPFPWIDGRANKAEEWRFRAEFLVKV